MNAHILRVLILVFGFNQISSQSVCESAETCGDCIGYAAERCVWCAEPIDKFQDVRCQPQIILSQNNSWCKDFVKDPESIVTNQRNEELRNGNEKGDAIQFKPQEIDIKLRPGVPASFSFVYKPDKDYPLDVYYLMDFSYTMREHFQKLKSQYYEIHTSLTVLTNNVRLGLGSFVEKPGFPYADNKIHVSYIFKNHISLTDNKTELMTKIESASNNRDNKTANYDDPEAILDALMQTMVCSEVKWRNSTRIIVTSTDGTYHSAGDGKMVGAITPHDMKCHYDNENAVLYDYPSVSQINKIASDKNIKIIFAVLDKVKNEYKALSKQVFSSEYAELNTNTNIVELIKSAYLNTVNNVMLFSNLPDNIDVKFDPACNKPDNNNCNLKHKGDITINVTLTATSCSPEGNYMIGVQGKTEGLKVKVTVDCQCDCEKDNKGKNNSENCSFHGLEQCGVCKCNDDRYGKVCQCNNTDTSKKIDQDKCMYNATSCSNRGNCTCGVCECSSGYHGKFCQFDGHECGSPECSNHGKCRNAKCVCDPGWRVHENCDCTSDTSKCMNPNSLKVCSDNGNCECGQCQCDASAKNVTYSGKFCECAKKGCDALNEYVLCNFNNKKNKADCDEKYNEDANVDFGNKSNLYSQEWSSARSCNVDLKNGSSVDYRYMCRSLDLIGIEKMFVIIQDQMNNPPAPNIWIPLGITIGIILLIGLLTIIAWKFLVDMYDAREYTKFEKEAIDAGFDVNTNPYYKEPQMKILNPTYNNRCE